MNYDEMNNELMLLKSKSLFLVEFAFAAGFNTGCMLGKKKH